MSDIDREFAERILSKIASLRQRAILKGDTDAIHQLNRYQIQMDAVVAKMDDNNVVNFPIRSPPNKT